MDSVSPRLSVCFDWSELETDDNLCYHRQKSSNSQGVYASMFLPVCFVKTIYEN